MSKHGALRASDADRDQIVERLHRAATEGRIAAEELEQRVTTALRARTYDELAATVADLPGATVADLPGATVADLPGRRERREPARRSASSWTLSVVRANPMLLLFVIPVLAVTMAMLLAATIVWAVLMVVVMILGGRRHVPGPPWIYARRHRPLPPRRYWA